MPAHLVRACVGCALCVLVACARRTGGTSALALAAAQRNRVPGPIAAARGQSVGQRMVCRRSLDSAYHDGQLAWRVHRSRRVLELFALPRDAPLEIQMPIHSAPPPTHRVSLTEARSLTGAGPRGGRTSTSGFLDRGTGRQETLDPHPLGVITALASERKAPYSNTNSSGRSSGVSYRRCGRKTDPLMALSG